VPLLNVVDKAELVLRFAATAREKSPRPEHGEGCGQRACSSVARALDAADQPALAINQLRCGRTPDAVDPARHVTGGVQEDGRDVPALLRRLLHKVRTLAEGHEQDLEPLGLELPVQWGSRTVDA
jgi:hypothetical protein